MKLIKILKEIFVMVMAKITWKKHKKTLLNTEYRIQHGPYKDVIIEIISFEMINNVTGYDLEFAFNIKRIPYNISEETIDSTDIGIQLGNEIKTGLIKLIDNLK